MQTVSLQVADEIKALGDALQVLIADIIAKKSVTAIAADALPNLMGAVSGYQNMVADIQLADDEAYLVRSLKLGINGK